VATVSDGTVTAVAVGSTTITAASTADPAKTASCTVTVVSQAVPLTGIRLDQSTLHLASGGTTTLGVIYNPGNTTQTGVTWSSSDPTVAVVDVNTGLIIAVAPGTATITAASTADPAKTAACTVTVVSQAVPLTGISLDRSTLNLAVGGPTTLVVIYNPGNTTQTGVSWSTGDAAVATVSGGTVTPVAAGTTTITATSTADPAKTAACAVTVEAEAVPLTGIGLSKTSLTLTKGGTETITVSYTPGNTTQTGVNWSTSDAAVATVSNGTITAVGGGTATITATSTADSTKKAECAVSVPVALEGISLPATFTIVRTLTGTIPVTYTPADTTQKGVTWSSSNTSAATVDPNTGLITAGAVASTTTIITATSTVDTTKTASCTVTVTEPRNGINVTFTGFEDETIDLGVVKESNYFVIGAPGGFSRYLWYVSGSLLSGETTPTLTIPVYNIPPGLYYITVIVEKSDGSHFSKTVKFTVNY
jgi:uncharacterized protein YjdB